MNTAGIDAAMTKAVTAVALMQLVEQQVVALDDPAGEPFRMCATCRSSPSGTC